jgi:long-chain acyl-CoA synthetase
VLPPAHIAALREHLPHVRIFSMYGLTECKRVSYLAPEDLDAHPMSVGKPMNNVDVYLLDRDGRPIVCGTGELVVRGANVMQGYWRDEEATNRVLRPGLLPGETVLHTGDLFTIDADGYMYFQSRTDDVIKSRGQKVSPHEIENVLHGAPGVCEAVVIGVPDPILGEALQAYVTLRPGAETTGREILLHCSRRLEDFMVPRSVDIVSSLPHTPSGKLVRRALLSAVAD